MWASKETREAVKRATKDLNMKYDRERDIMFAFIIYLECALVKFEEPHVTLSESDRIKFYYEAYKKSIIYLQERWKV